MRFQAKVMDEAMGVRALRIEAKDEAEARHMIAAAGLQVLDVRGAGWRL
jgi:hypothetical protein